ncbi:hypothetical protein [Stenotrophomonas maltophilia]|uniref:hypothetical protein n=1 Tax=Stenotrophomonas maltophilia TaxID=40324 RepID=UPI0012DB0289|nr:hypothetical protein [Stenotrophomonas maltophilia]
MTILEVESVDGAAVPVVVGIGTAFGKGFVAGVAIAIAGAGYAGDQLDRMAW